ncbi:FKBP-type peptidyl-prolyl cis-trans isomerase [Candidatus Pelagibacter sp.]|jgi:rhodanese-related sulfurtransferase|uniref:FKBP-type peptidyl-prolyl cis-trans isomerase n=1 Tax=uncultured Candidatus Pelagibacter sp. TaxID=372654 RepID=UPI0023398EA3|nr:FKBP-type peptidyl-prolyl cis-trans isomerase [uncultured Candidatus Pelagibacter sp.]MDB4811655.1 FKBP-type peptidyl-prolyl cis-trans isomerase [Candidatus Pelagibacter sp.]MDC0466029.1 FKBP-type peptidyl-prolyl cis-trans isomerase [Candidatus Pelagibacter sp.]
MKKYFLIISLFICFNLTAAEIEIISDKPGDGKKIIYHSWVQIEYTGSFESGEVFDTNIGKDRPLVVQIGMKEVIPGFERGIIGTTKGTKRKIKIPAELAYGEKGGGDVIPPNTDLIFEFEIIDVLDPHYKMINSDELIKRIKDNAVALDIRLENQWENGVIKGTFQETAFNKDGKFNVYLMDKVRALAAEESQNIEIIFISHDGETAAILGNAFAEDLGFKNVSVLKGGILQWLKEDRKLVSHKKDN